LERQTHALTDDILLLAPRASSLRSYLREASDQLAGADPGLKQLRTALEAVLGIASAVGLVDLFVHATGALQRSDLGGSAADATRNHGLLIVSMLIAGVVALMAATSVTDTTAQGQLLSTLLLPVPMIASMSLGLALGPYRIVSLAFLVALLGLAVYARRWGPRGSAAGLVAFNGGFLGFFLHTELAIGDIGWLSADLGIGLLASLLVRFALFRPDHAATLSRMRRSWRSRAAGLLELSAEVLEADEQGRSAAEARLRRHAVRLNESTLIVEAQLAESEPELAAERASRLFDAELALANCARFAAALAAISGDDQVRGLAASALRAARDDVAGSAAAIERLRNYEGPSTRVTLLAHRLAASIGEYVDEARASATGAYDTEEPGSASEQTPAFTPAVELSGGFLPGSAPVSLVASTTPGRGGRLDRTVLAPHVRAAIQVTVAATLAVVVGDLVSGSRLYWAVLATFLAFLATSNSSEQVRKALFRVTGTAIGIVIGDLLVHLTGAHVWASLLIVLAVLFLGVYLVRVNYAFMVIGITVTMSQLYAQLGEFSWRLLVLRLVETAVGVGAVVLTVCVVVPLRPQRVLTAALLGWFQALRALLDDTLRRLTDGGDAPLRAKARQLDAAYAALESTATAVRSTVFGRNSAQLAALRSIAWSARNYARSLAAGVEASRDGGNPALRCAAQQLRSSTATIEERIRVGGPAVYTRSASLVESASHALSPADVRTQLATRDLMLLDATLARLAATLGMQVRDLDTSEVRT